MCQLQKANTQRSAHKLIIKDAYSDYCKEKLTCQKLSNPVILILHPDQLGLSWMVHRDGHTASRCLPLPRQLGPGLLPTGKALWVFPPYLVQINIVHHHWVSSFLLDVEFRKVLMHKYTMAAHLKIYLEFWLPAWNAEHFIQFILVNQCNLNGLKNILAKVKRKNSICS